MQQVNALGGTLREQRLGALEATALLRKVMEEIDVAIFAFDRAATLRLVNRAGERLLAQPAERLLGARCDDAGPGGVPDGEPQQTIQRTFPGGSRAAGASRAACSARAALPHQLAGDLPI